MGLLSYPLATIAAITTATTSLFTIVNFDAAVTFTVATTLLPFLLLFSFQVTSSA
jgi:hypothetical protein